jgi:hypothetical protein
VASSASSAKPPSNAKWPKTPPRTFFPDDDDDWGNWKVKLLGKEDRKDEQDEKECKKDQDPGNPKTPEVGLRFSFPLPFQGCPFWARFHVLVFALSLFSCVPLFASWLSNFHLIVIFTSSSFPFLFIFISLSGP